MQTHVQKSVRLRLLFFTGEYAYLLQKGFTALLYSFSSARLNGTPRPVKLIKALTAFNIFCGITPQKKMRKRLSLSSSMLRIKILFKSGRKSYSRNLPPPASVLRYYNAGAHKKPSQNLPAPTVRFVPSGKIMSAVQFAGISTVNLYPLPVFSQPLETLPKILS